jgi:CheY-like chemotaxis protein
MAKQFVPDLILMDIALPGIDGIQAFKAIRAVPGLEKIPIIALTASAMTQDREGILAQGFDAFIPKPIIEREFLKVIREVLYG